MPKRHPQKRRGADHASDAVLPFDTAAARREQTSGGNADEIGELYRLLVESVQDYAIFALDPRGYILSWNPGAERFLGYTASEIVGKHFSIFYPEERIAEGFPEFELREAARTGRFEDEGWRLRKDGTRLWANVVITALRNGHGELVGFAKVTRDLTERRTAEEVLRLSEERFRLLVQGVRDYAIFMLDPQGRIATWNEGAERIKGYAADEIIGRHFSVFYPPERVAEGFPEHELEVATRVGQFEDEDWRVRKDGSRFWANVLITAIRDSEGKLVGFAKVTRDLTERRVAEQRVIENASRVAAEEAARRAADLAKVRAERLQVLTSSLSAAHTIPEIVHVVFDEALHQMQIDAGTLALVDDSGNYVELIESRGYDIPRDATRRMPLSTDVPMTEAIRALHSVHYTRTERDARFPAIADLLRPFEATVAFPLVVRGRSIGVLSLHRRGGDVSADDLDFVQAFAQQCALAVERAQLYEGEQLARRESEEARARADEANRAKSEFLAAMSHELRTPLNAIGGYAELLLLGISGPITPEQKEQIERIRRSQQRLLAIINDLLNLSRVEAGQVEYTFSAVPVADIMDAVAQMISPQAMAKGQRFDIHACSNDATVWADRTKTEQVLLNLLSNAVKFTPVGGSITFACDPHPDRVAVTVRDTGIGMPQDQLARIFEPFVQLGRTLSTTNEGTGLGLAISRDLARGMHGDILVESAVGKGSTFTLSLPRAETREKPATATLA
jgi:PAS domain S-box-containing protein